MNRIEEYNNLMQELEQPVPELEHTFDRARRKQIRRKRLIRPFVALAASFVIFVGLVNLSAPVATACSRIPILRELTEAVSFSDSLSAAIANEYVQTISLSQTDNNITATVEYLIVDQKQVSVFFRLNSDVYTDITADPTVLSADGKRDPFCSYDLNNYHTPIGELQSITLDFGQDDVPNSLYLEMNIRDWNDLSAGVAPAAFTAYMIEQGLTENPEYFAHFNFLLEFDPELSAKPKVYSVNQTILLDGNEITFTNVEIYPSHLRLNATDSSKNRKWLEILNFYVQTDDGTKWESPSIGSLGSGIRDIIKGTSTMSYKTESPYFYESDSFEIVITGAWWSDKEIQSNIYEWKAEEPITLFVD